MCINHGIKIIPKEGKKKKRRSSFTLISVYAIYFYSFGTNLLTYVEGEAEICQKKVGGRGRRLEGRKDREGRISIGTGRKGKGGAASPSGSLS